jgi:hypothetical protein
MAAAAIVSAIAALLPVVIQGTTSVLGFFSGKKATKEELLRLEQVAKGQGAAEVLSGQSNSKGFLPTPEESTDWGKYIVLAGTGIAVFMLLRKKK